MTSMRVPRSKENLAHLAARMLDADEQAFVEFADYFGPRFRALFISRGLSPSDAEDLAVSCVSDTALKVDKYRAENSGNFEAWTFTIARHYVADWQRKKKLGTVALDESTAAALPAPDDFDVEPNKEIVAAVQDALIQLTEADVISIKYRNLGAEHSFAELALRLGVSQEAARVRHFRALKRLRALLEMESRITNFLRKDEVRKECHE